MADEVIESARIEISLDDTGVVADATALGRRIKQVLDRSVRGAGATIRRDIQRALRRAVAVRVRPDITGFVTQLRALLRGERIPIPVVADLTRLDARISQHRAPDVRVGVDVDTAQLRRALDRLGDVAAGAARSLRSLLVLGAVEIAAAAATTAVGGLLAALAPAVGLLAAFPTAVAGVGAALGTLQLALVGVADALGAAFGADAQAYAEALERLAPAARQAVGALRDLAPELLRVQQSVQQAFFAQFAQQITATVRDLLPLRDALGQVAAELGVAAGEALRFLQTRAAFESLRVILAATRDAVDQLAAGVRPLAQGFLAVAAAVAAAFGTDLGATLADLATQFGAFLSQIAASGEAIRWVDQAIGVFQQLGTVIANVGSTIAGVLQAADTAGGGLLNNLAQATRAVAEFVNSATGQQQLAAIFETIATVGAQLGPILAALVTQIGAFASALAPVTAALGPALVALIDALGPALAALAPSLQAVAQGLAQAFTDLDLAPLGAALGSIVEALAPLLPLAGELIATLAAGLAPALQNLATLFTPIVDALAGALLPLLPQIAAGWAQLVTAMAPLAQGLGQAVAGIIGQGLAPLLANLAAVLLQVAAAALPVIDGFTRALLPVLPQLVTAFTQVVAALLPILPPLAQLATALVPLTVLITQLAAPVLQVAASFAAWTAINLVVPIINRVVAALTWLITNMASAVEFIAQLPGRIVAALSTLAAQVSGVFRAAFTAARTVVVSFLTGVVVLFGQLPARVAAALSSLRSRIAGVLRGAIGSARSAARSVVSAIVDVFATLPGRVLAVVGDLGSRIMSRIRAGLPGSIRGLLPFFADGGIVDRPVVGVLGEAGREVVIPLTKPQRARQLAEESGLLNILTAANSRSDSRRRLGAGMVNHFTIHEAGDAHTTAQRVINRMALAAGGLS